MVLIMALAVLTGCSITDVGEPGNNENIIVPGSDFIKSMTDWSVDLFKEGFKEEENYLISPLSVSVALSMAANGADGETLSQMTDTLGLDIDDANKHISSYLKAIENKDISIANSIWINDIDVEEAFIDKNIEYYKAKINKDVFDDKTADKINNWVKENTNEMIKDIVDNVSPESVMYLVNAIAFESEWDEGYEPHKIFDDNFTNYKGSKKIVEMMKSEEGKYLDNGKATGFVKPYKDNKFSFVAILPNEDVGIKEYVENMTGDSLHDLISSYEEVDVNAYIPKFRYDYSMGMNDILKNLGIEDAFDRDKADFSNMTNEAVYINNVVHKSFIEVDEVGTKAAAATSVEMSITSVVMEDIHEVKLDRPFIYIIMDNEANIPIFMGAVMDIGGWLYAG